MNQTNISDLPTDRVDEIRGQLHAQWKIDADVLNKSHFRNRGAFETAKAKLNAKYQHKEHELFAGIRAEQQKQQRVQELIGQPVDLEKGRFSVLPRTRVEEAKLRMELGAEAERLVFPEQIDPRAEHQRNLLAQNRVMNLLDKYVEKDGKLYYAKLTKDKKYYTEEANTRIESPTQDEVQRYLAAFDALPVLEREESGILGEISGTGVPSSARLQGLMTGERRRSWWKRFKERALTGSPYFTGRKTTPASPGTFGDKVRKDISPPRKEDRPLTPVRQQEPQVIDEEPQRVPSRKELLAEYIRLGGGNTPESKAFADKNLR